MDKMRAPRKVRQGRKKGKWEGRAGRREMKKGQGRKGEGKENGNIKVRREGMGEMRALRKVKEGRKEEGKRSGKERRKEGQGR